MDKTLKTKMTRRIARARRRVYLVRDFADLAAAGQVRRALAQLVRAQVLARIGKGLYVRLRDSVLSPGSPVLDGDFGGLVREALDRLGVPWEVSQALVEYNAGQSSQVPANCVLVVPRRFRRRIAYGGMVARFIRREDPAHRNYARLGQTGGMEPMKKGIPFDRVRREMMKDPEFRREYDALADEFAFIEQAVAARIRAGKTQAQVAEAMGVSQPAVAKIEAGKVKNLDSLQRYASAVGCKVRLELVPAKRPAA